MVAWAWFNGLLTSRTRLFIKGNEVVDLQTAGDGGCLPSLPAASASTHAKRSTARVKFVIWRLSSTLEYDPTAAFRNQVVHLTSASWTSSALASNKIAGRQRGSAVRNSWNRSAYAALQRRAGDDQALKTILGKMHGMPRRRTAWKCSAAASTCVV